MWTPPAVGGFFIERMKTKIVFCIGVLIANLVLAGCSQTYPPDRIKESIQEICAKEYGIPYVDVKIVGKTIGVYLPIKKLFMADFKEALLKKDAKMSDIENLFRPSPEALEKVEDVLFSISRVLLSTDLNLHFYTLHATDVEETGLQLVLVGYVDDIKRVRLWDISREEYRKRILHEIRLSRAAVWHRPIRSFFEVLQETGSRAALQPFFETPLLPEIFESFFFLKPDVKTGGLIEWKLGELRSIHLENTQILVHVPVTVQYDPAAVSKDIFKVPSGTSLEYFFILSFASDRPQILRVIPLSFLDENGAVQKMEIPAELDIEKDMSNWEVEFSLSDISEGDFLAEQLTRRAQSLLFSDERVQNTFDSLHLIFHYNAQKAKKYFSLDLDAKLKTPTPWAPGPTTFHEDVLHVLNLASREFVDVLRSYKFSDYDYLQLNLASDPISHAVGREQLELFRRNKADLQGLLAGLNPV